jgi:hypothetical protein
VIFVRDTKEDGRGPVQGYAGAEWRAFIAGVRSGDFDLDESGRLSWAARGP